MYFIKCPLGAIKIKCSVFTKVMVKLFTAITNLLLFTVTAITKRIRTCW